MYGLSNGAPMTLSELEGHFCCYEWQNASCGPSASAGGLLHLQSFLSIVTSGLRWKPLKT